MAVLARAVTVATTATRIDSDEASGVSAESLAVFNNGAATVFLGGAAVTTAAGYPLAAGEHIGFDLDPADQLYGIVATGTVELRVVEV